MKIFQITNQIFDSEVTQSKKFRYFDAKKISLGNSRKKFLTLSWVFFHFGTSLCGLSGIKSKLLVKFGISFDWKNDKKIF